MKLFSFFRTQPQPQLEYIPSRDFFNQLHDPRYQRLDELMRASSKTEAASVLPRRKKVMPVLISTPTF